MKNIADPLVLFVPLFFLFGFPLFADPNGPAKAYLFYFSSLFFLLGFVRSNSHLHLSPVACWWFGLVLFFFFSAFFSSDPASALIYSSMMLTAGCFFIVVKDKVTKSVDYADAFIWVLALTAVLFATLGLYQYHDYLLFGKHKGMLIPSFLPSTSSRLAGPIGQPNFHATVMLIGLTCLPYVYKVRQLAVSRFEKWGLVLVSIVLLVNFFLSNSRAGYLSLLIVIGLMYIYSRYRYRLNREHLFSRKEIATILSIFAISWGLYWSVINLISPLIGSTEISLEVMRGGGIYNRLNMWVSALLMAVDFPLLGVGLDNYKIHLAEYQIRAHDLINFYFEDLVYGRWAHNEYLQILAEGGLAAFIVMIGFLIASGKGIWRNLINTTTAYSVFAPLALVPLLVHAGFEWPLRYAPMLAIFMLLIAISLPVTEQGFSFSIASPLRKGILTVLCLVFLGLGTWSLYWDMEAGILKRHTSDEQLLVHNLKRLERLADHPVTALIILRQGMYPYLTYAFREQDVEMARFLVPILERIIHLEGAYWQWYNLGRIQLVAGYHDASRMSVEKAIHLNPVYEPSWQLQRQLNLLNAVEQTGRPMESFLPPLAPQPSLDLLNLVQ